MMAKSSSTRHRERKKSSPSTYFKESKFDNSSKTLNADLSPTLGKTSQNLRNQWLWRCFIFTLLLLTGIISLYFDNNYKFFPHTWSSIMAGLSGTPKRDAEVPCSVMDNSTVDHRSNLTLAEFIRCYDAKRPVVITDILKNWKAMNWTKSFLVRNYGDKRVSMKATEGPLNKAQGFAVPLKNFAEHVHEGQPELWIYLEDELFIEMNPELREDLGQPVYLREDFFQLLPKEIRPWNAMLLWGTAHSRSSLHIDPYNWTGTNAVLRGKKMWKLFPPGQDHLLYVRKNQRCGFPLDCLKYNREQVVVNSFYSHYQNENQASVRRPFLEVWLQTVLNDTNSPIDAFNPDYKQYPKFRRAQAISFTQQAGDLLIIPTGWFHQAYNPVETMAISSQVMNSQNYKLVLEEIYKAGEIDARKLPRNFENLSAQKQVEAVVKIIPKDVIEKGRRVTEDILDQLKWKGKTKQRNK